jgi:hypothetical protein
LTTVNKDYFHKGPWCVVLFDGSSEFTLSPEGGTMVLRNVDKCFLIYTALTGERIESQEHSSGVFTVRYGLYFYAVCSEVALS